MCCLHLRMIARQITSDSDARTLCSCIQNGVISVDGSLVTGDDISRLPKGCMIDIKIPPIDFQTNCSKWKEETIKGHDI
ncbi:hypothetical protein L6452_36662 [Arctium lappa]|uniref:Uncharacterized protein n=1 Tax=Arctium lappa TaxID=4217 RepID=A0ACB8YAA5_ARCLA|nr:hypothetical protein L6452_36662 [Arctium lappa]